LTVWALRHVAPGCRASFASSLAHERRAALDLGAAAALPAAGGRRLLAEASVDLGAPPLRAFGVGALLPGGYDHVYDAAASGASVAGALRVVAPGGVVTLVGPGGPIVPLGDASLLAARGVTLAGLWGGAATGAGSSSRSAFASALELVASAAPPLGGLVTHRFRPDHYRRALAVARRPARHGALRVALTSFE
jgi:threonine dehydrogenase-like Zn-dependent dehydrogenase